MTDTPPESTLPFPDPQVFSPPSVNSSHPDTHPPSIRTELGIVTENVSASAHTPAKRKRAEKTDEQKEAARIKRQETAARKKAAEQAAINKLIAEQVTARLSTLQPPPAALPPQSIPPPYQPAPQHYAPPPQQAPPVQQQYVSHQPPPQQHYARPPPVERQYDWTPSAGSQPQQQYQDRRDYSPEPEESQSMYRFPQRRAEPPPSRNASRQPPRNVSFTIPGAKAARPPTDLDYLRKNRTHAPPAIYEDDEEEFEEEDVLDVPSTVYTKAGYSEPNRQPAIFNGARLNFVG